jgi:ribokinase
MPAPRILVVGSSNTDMIIKMERIPRPGETIVGGDFFSAAGGKGANQAVAAARAGGQVTLVARVGRDILGEQALAGFVREGINAGHVVRDPAAPSGVALIFVGGDGENSIAVAPGANNKLSPDDVKSAQGAFSAADILVLQLEMPLETVEAAAQLAQRAGLRVILNPAPAPKEPLPARLLQDISILTPNETEAELLTGIKVDSAESAAKAAAKLLAQGVGAVIVTLGAKGAYVASAAGGKLIPGFKVEAVDTTAAGDTFNGALAVALAEGQAFDQAVRFAHAAAAISVTRLGAQPSAPKRDEIEKLLAPA